MSFGMRMLAVGILAAAVPIGCSPVAAAEPVLVSDAASDSGQREKDGV